MIKKTELSYNIITKKNKSVRNLIKTANQKQYLLRQGIKEGIAKGKRLSVQQQRNSISTIQAEIIGIKRALPPELWYAFLGTISPLPGGTILGIAFGKIIKILKSIKK